MAKKGSAGFDEYYAEVYGSRWPRLKSALLQPVTQVARTNRFAKDNDQSPVVTDSAGLLSHYVMDPASIFAAAALEVQAGDQVLDLCAAPGGKSLILAEALAEQGELVCNEMSDRRRARLRAVLEDYLPKDLLSRVRVTGHDGAKWCLYEQEAFDRILVDAPCSGERHLLENREELELWSPARSKNLAVRQYALLASAHAVLRKGGRMVYSTCSISPVENDAVIARLLKKRAGEVEVVRPQPYTEIGEATEYGRIILPDSADELSGIGPIFFCVLQKTSSQSDD
jgi:5-methylcytosine rRNA methyltransferase NSUN4